MIEAVREHGWDGEWFLRAYDREGNPVGSHGNEEGGSGSSRRACARWPASASTTAALARSTPSRSTRNAARARPPGARILRYRVELGEISSYPPGYKENGGVFSHTNPWIAIAETMLGNGDRALDRYLRINPSAREELSDLHRCEPYVYAQMIAGKEAAVPGEAKNSWLTGSAAWNYVAITQDPRHPAGTRGAADRPLPPGGLGGFSAVRRFRGPPPDRDLEAAGSTGRLSSLTIDGDENEGTLVTARSPGAQVEVEGAIG